MSDLISRQAAIEALEREKTYCTAYKDGYTQTDVFKQYNMGLTDGIKALSKLPSAQPEWDNHTVACLLAEMFGDDCACNFNGIDEWLPYKCEVIDSCPNPAGVACWEQFLKHRAERRSE